MSDVFVFQTHCAQIVNNLLDIILDRSTSKNLHQTPMQQQYQYQANPQQQRVLKSGSRQGRTQTFLANSTRPPMRTNNKQIVNSPQQTPVTNFRQQQQPPPPVKQAGQMRNGGMKKNNNNNSEIN